MDFESIREEILLGRGQENLKLNILSKSRYNVDLILVMYYISAGQTSLLQVQ